MKKKYLIRMTEQQIEDTLSALGIAQNQFKLGLHAQSPNFRKSVTKIEALLWRVNRRIK